jgi:transcriptional regulator GlxA family with amidase domain
MVRCHLFMSRTLAILVFPDAETLDFAGPYEVFSVASVIAEPKKSSRFDVKLVAQNPGLVAARHGFTVQATHGFADLPRPDILLVPGGFGTRALVNDPATIAWIRTAAENAELVLSVCTGSFLLAKAGLLEGLPCTTHHQSIARMREDFPGQEVHEHVRFVDTGRVISSAGISAGIDMSLHVVSRLHGITHAAMTARYMEYAWTP